MKTVIIQWTVWIAFEEDDKKIKSILKQQIKHQAKTHQKIKAYLLMINFRNGFNYVLLDIPH